MKSFKKSITLLFLFMIVGIGNLWASTSTITITFSGTLSASTDYVDDYQLISGYSITGLPSGSSMRIGKKETGWNMDASGICVATDAPLALLDMHNGDKVTVNWAGSDDGVQAYVTNQIFSVSGSNRSYLNKWDKITSGTDYYMAADGKLELWLHKNYSDHISSIVIEREDNPEISILSGSNETNLIDMNFDESTAISISPANATVTYTPSNPKIAVMRDNYSGDVMFKRTGIVTITATMTVGGVEYTGSYNVTVKAEDATFALSNNNKTYTLTGAGVLTARVETSVPNITVEFGTTNNSLYNTTIVREVSTGTFVSTTLDYNGWQHMWPVENNKGLSTEPYQGTFYVFKPTASGTLTISGIRTNNNTAVLVDVTDNYTQKIEFNTSDASGVVSKSASVVNGHVYYLYGNTYNTNGGDWTAFQLNAYTFDPTFTLSKTADIYMRAGGTAPTTINNALTVSGTAGDETCVVKCEGNISSATATVSSGQLNISNITYSTDNDKEKGGAIIVKISGSNGEGMFVYTVPYKEHSWQFATTSGSAAKININNMTDKGNGWTNNDWCLTYEVRTYSGGVLADIKDPVKAAVSPISGNNAFYIGETAGLWFETSSQRFGSRVTAWSVDQSTLSKDEQRDQPVSNATAVDYVEFNGDGSYVIIPQLLEGSYVRVWWEPHAAGTSGAHFLADNLTDLDGTDVTGQFIVTGTAWSGGRDRYWGNTIFKVKNRGNVKLELDDSGWNKIVRIDISDDCVFKSDMYVCLKDGGREVNQAVRNNATWSHEENTPISNIKFSGAYTNSEKARYPIYTCTSEGSVTFTQTTETWNSGEGVRYDDLVLSNISGRGNILIRQDMKDNSGTYVFDRSEAWIAIGSYQQQTYPHTWDFTSYNMDRPALANRATTKMAATVDNNKYSQWQSNYWLKEYSTEVSSVTGKTLQKYLFANGSELCTSTVDNGIVTITSIPETKGLKIGMPTIGDESKAERANTNIRLNGTNLQITKPANISNQTTITVPSVGSGKYVFVKGSNLSGITVTGATEIATTFNLPSDVRAFQVTGGSAQDVVLSALTMEIEKIAVTDVTKSLNVLGYATESRSVAIDHSYTGEFTTDDANAYAIQYSSYDYTKATVSKSAEVKVVPANTGVVLYKANASTSCTVPLFYPAINNATQSESDAAALTGNLMAPCVSGKLFTSETEGENTVFIMSRTFYTYYKGIGNSEQKTSNVEAFYRMKLGSTDASNTMGANKAYLLIPTSSLPTAVWNSGNQGAKGYIYFAETLELQDETTDIKNIETIVVTEDNAPQEVYYTISGLRIDGKPSKPGLYIVNGVKRYIK